MSNKSMETIEKIELIEELLSERDEAETVAQTLIHLIKVPGQQIVYQRRLDHVNEYLQNIDIIINNIIEIFGKQIVELINAKTRFTF